MLLRKFLFLIIGGLLISGLLAACGDAAGMVTTAPSTSNDQAGAAASPKTSQPTVNQAISSGSSQTATSTPGATTPAGTTNPAKLDPCSLFTKEDFKAVLNKDANDPDQWEGVCDFQFAETLVPGSDEAFGLTVRLDNKTYTFEKFAQMAQLLGTQKVDGIGDAAYLKPSQSEDESSILLVLKGDLNFDLELLQPAAVTADQRLSELKAAALKVLARLAAPGAVKAIPTELASSTSTPVDDSAKITVYNPCQLFTGADFATIMNSQPQAPQKNEDVATHSCNYQAVSTEDTLTLYLQKETYDKARFESEWKDQAYTKTAPVMGLGDEAFWTEGSVSRLYVLKGKLAFWFELTLENDITSSQKLEILKKGALKVLGGIK